MLMEAQSTKMKILPGLKENPHVMMKTILVVNMGENIPMSCQSEQKFSHDCESEVCKYNISILKNPECSLK